MKHTRLHFINRGDWPRFAGGVFITVLLLVIVYYGRKAIVANAHPPIRLVVYAFSTQEEVLSQGILPAFEKQWEAETGRKLEIEAVFGPSGTLAGQINLGAPADICLLYTSPSPRDRQRSRMPSSA